MIHHTTVPMHAIPHRVPFQSLDSLSYVQIAHLGKQTFREVAIVSENSEGY
ncbi:MAG: hypothetical protein WCJ84_00340 [Candidatus Peregrinibacteria bacterium]